jgi:integrase/recombinase XerD
MTEPMQPPMFPDQASLTRIRAEQNEWRFYRMEIWPDLFGRALLARQWGRIGSAGGVGLRPAPRRRCPDQRAGPPRRRQTSARLSGQPGLTRRPPPRAPVRKPAGNPARAVRTGPAARAKAPAPLFAGGAGIRLYRADGAREYVTAAERDAFLREAERADRQVRTLCMTLAYAGCRLSEALALTADRVDLAAGVLVFATLKKRHEGVFRAVPVPPTLLDALDLVHGIRERQVGRDKGRGERLWPVSRMTGWRAVHAVMQAAGLDGPQASPKGLRHGFGLAAVSAGIPLNLVQKWLGHAQLTTTAIYADAVGAEEKDIARRMWGDG